MIQIDDKLFKEALNRVAASEDGQIVLAVLALDCHWNEVYVSSENSQVTQYHAARRGVYGGLRKLIDNKYLKDIEFNYGRKVNDGSGSTTRKRKRSTTGKSGK